MSTPSCDWVRLRLPLEIGPIEDDFRDTDPILNGFGISVRIADRSEGVDLEAEVRLKITRHLDECANCRRHQAELLDAMSALSAVSAIVPLEAESPSLWPALELRIRERERLSGRATTARSVFSAVRAFSFGRLGGESLPTAMRLRLIRSRDAVLEAVDGLLDGCRDMLPERDLRLSPGIAFAGLLAALLGGVITLQAVRSQSRSRLEIAQGARPLVPVSAAKQAGSAEGGIDHSEIDIAAEAGGNRWFWHRSPGTVLASSEVYGSEESHSGLPGPLAQAEIHPPSRSNSAVGGGNSGSGSATSGPMSSTSKFDFDLERGTPMAPDSRDAKPAY